MNGPSQLAIETAERCVGQLYSTDPQAVRSQACWIQEAIDKRVAELEAEVADLRERCDFKGDHIKAVEQAIVERAERIAALQAILETVPHDRPNLAWKCSADCPRCAYEKIKQK